MSIIERMDPIKLGDRLRVARSSAGITQEEAARKLGVARTTLITIEQGQRRVRADELQLLADAYGIGLNELFRESAVYVDLAAKFRRIGSDSSESTVAQDAVRLLNRLVSSMVELETRLGQRLEFHYPPEKSIFSGEIESQAEDLALDLRHRLGLGLAPIADIVSLVELELGIRIFVRPIDSSICGLFAFDPAVGPCMLVNSKHSIERQAQTVAHETGHFLTTRTSPDIYEERMLHDSREEKFMGCFASSFLMPAAAIRRRFRDINAVGNSFSPRHLILMAHAFRVSVEAMCRRLEGLKLLPEGTFDSLKERGFAIEQAKNAIGNLEPSRRIQSPPRLILLAVDAYHKNLFSEGQLCEMLAMSRIELRTYLDMFEDNGLNDAITFKN